MQTDYFPYLYGRGKRIGFYLADEDNENNENQVNDSEING